MCVCVYFLIGSFKHCATPILFTDDPGDLASDKEAKQGYPQKHLMDEAENGMEGDRVLKKTCGLQQAVS